MKQEIRNGVPVIINETKEEATQTLQELLAERGMRPLNERELKDWGIRGGETNAQLQEWVNDYVSEIESERAAEKDNWRYDR